MSPESVTLAEVVQILQFAEMNEGIRKYCNRANKGGQWLYQINCQEFIFELADILNRILSMSERKGPIVEVMGGDGKLTKFLRTVINNEIIATDLQTGRDNIVYPDFVLKMDARMVVKQLKPGVIIMC